MRQLWLIALAILIHTVAVEAQKCRQNGKQYKNNAKWIASNCKKEYKCKKGVIDPKAYSCPSNSKCNNGKCECKSGFEESKKDSNGWLKKCREKSTDCEKNGKSYKNNAKWISSNCKKEYKCKKGVIDPKAYSCPSNSKCNNGKCECKSGFEESKKDSNGWLKKCREKGNEGDCTDNGNIYKNKQNWLQNDCKKRFYCKNGGITKRSFSCPANSNCIEGKCACDFGYSPENKASTGFLKKCKEDKEHKCGSGFRRKFGKCLAIDKHGKKNYNDAKAKCREKGGRLLIVDDLFSVFGKLRKDLKQQFYIGGSPQLAAKDIKNIKSEKARTFILSTMNNYKCSEAQRVKSFKRFSGKAKPADLNAITPMSSRCLAFDFKNERAPVFVKCSTRLGYICEEELPLSVSVDEGDVNAVWSDWYNTNTDTKKGDKESIKYVLKKLNKNKDNKKRLCKKPIAVECRDKATKTKYSKGNTNGLKLRHECEKSSIYCRNKDQKGGAKCPDFEVRFKCPEDDGNDCSVRAIRKGCEDKGRRCVNRADGPVCVKQKRKKSKKEKISTSSCVLNGQKLTLHKCKASGDPHYTSLDGLSFDFQGACSYEFMSTCNSYVGSEVYPSFSISVKNFKKSPDGKVSWTKSFEFSVGDKAYYFEEDRLYVISGFTRKCNPVDFADDNIKVTGVRKGKYLTLTIETNFCLKIVWANHNSINVYVPDVYKNHMCGLCGNFDGNKENDLYKPGTSKKMTAKEIGEEFHVKGPEGESCSSVVPVPTPCSDEKKREFKAPNFCGIFDVNSQSPLNLAVRSGSDASSLNDNLDQLNTYLMECILDICWDKQTDRCYDLADNIEEIQAALVLSDPEFDKAWRKYANCENTEETRCANKPNMVYSRAFVASCQDKCKNQENSADCDDETTVAGCVCKDGFFEDAHLNCVPVEECDKSCSVDMENGDVVNLNDGEEYVIIPCLKKAVCNKGNLDEVEMTPCSEHARCVALGKKCKCKKGFVGDGVSCKTDLKCRKGFMPFGGKCYMYVPKKMDWDEAAINCGGNGGVLARYDEAADDEIGNFIKELPKLSAKASTKRKTLYCKGGSSCKLPRNYVGSSVRVKNKKDVNRCKGKFSLSEDGTSVRVTGDCRAKFVVKMINAKNQKSASEFRVWIGGNSDVISQKKRILLSPLQVDPPRMVDMATFQGQTGCFQARLNKNDALLVTPNPKCSTQKESICEYENPGKPTYDPNDFKGIKQKANHEEAIELCAKENRPLAIITNKQQLKRVHEILTKLNGNGWISAKYNGKKGKFMWSDNTKVSGKNWAKKEPNNFKGAKNNDELCVSMSKRNGRWHSDVCSDRVYPVCGPPLDVKPVEYSPFYKVKNFKSLGELKRILARKDADDYVCEKPLMMECVAQTKKGEWVNSDDKEGKAITCRPRSIKCRGKGLRCSTLKVRFLCPTENNPCRELKRVAVTACDAGRSCVPVKNHYVCRCPNGIKYNKHTKSCSQPCGHCYTWGDPHYTMYNGDRYDFMGTCMYKYSGMCDLAEFENDPNFDVYTKNEPCGKSGAACIYKIEVHLRNIHVTRGDVRSKENFVFKIARSTSEYTFNGVEITQEEIYQPGAFTVTRRKDFFELYSEVLELSVLFTGTKLTVKIPNRFRGKMCGLCGDCGTNGFRQNDGSILTVPKNGQKLDKSLVIPAANIWIVPHADSDPQKCKAVKPLDDCKPELKAKLEAPNMCGIFKDTASSISSCFSKINPEEFYENCMTDGCNADAMESVCNSIKSYAQSCMEKNEVLDWRTDDFCPYDCGDKVYRSVASCQHTCGRNTVTAASCNEEPEEGCVCPDDLIRRGDECVKPDQCGCEVMLNEGQNLWRVNPGDFVLMPGCQEKLICELLDDGLTSPILESFQLDPNAICRSGPPPAIECAKGFFMNEDGLTCTRDPEGCGKKYTDKDGMCVLLPPGKSMWRQAVSRCNNNDGTLVLVDTNAKLSELGKIMAEKKIDQLFISGQVRASAGEDNIPMFEPVLTTVQKGKVEYVNFDYQEPSVIAIQLSGELTIDDLKSNDVILALVAKLEEDVVNIYAVPRNTVSNFICEERDVPDEDTKWYGPCNSDNVMDDGESESRSSLKDNPDCQVCPVPMDIKCTAVPGAVGLVTGDCRITRSKTYYTCDQGGDCIDQAISTRCAKDTNECDEGLDDCSEKSKCINTIGAYICKCSKEFPVMVKGKCQAVKKCRMSGPQTSQDYVFSVNGLSGVPSYFDYHCNFQIGGVCDLKYGPVLGIPSVTVYSVTDQSKVNIKHAIAGAIYETSTDDYRTWAVDADLLKEGTFMFGKDDKIEKTVIGSTNDVIRTRFTFKPPSTMIIQHLDNYFRIEITFPYKVKLQFSEAYKDIMCGVCSLEPENPKDILILTEEESKTIAISEDEPCRRFKPSPASTIFFATEFTTTRATTAPEMLPTTRPELLPPSPFPPSTTSFPPTTSELPRPETAPTTTPEIVVEYFCPEIFAMCDTLDSVCPGVRDECFTSVCFGSIPMCDYLTMRSFECSPNAVLRTLTDNMECDAVCGQNAEFRYLSDVVQPTCTDPNGEGSIEESIAGGVFSCGCEDGFVLSAATCTPIDDCGCNRMEGDYVKKGKVWNNANCTVKHTCIGGNVIQEEPLSCSNNADCEFSSEGYVCKCDEGFFGEPEMENGCTKGDDEDPTKVCFDVLVDEAMERKCACKMGYVSNCSECQDLNECQEGLHDCDLSKEKCVNVPGSFNCECADGFSSENGKCIDNDECEDGTAKCNGDNEGCINTPGGFRCECCAGFTEEAGACILNGDVEILVDRPQCCLSCDDPKRCNEVEALPYCLVTSDGKPHTFKNYKSLFQYACVNNINAPRNKIYFENCPSATTSGAVPIATFPITTRSSGGISTTGAGGAEQSTESQSGGQSTAPAPLTQPQSCSSPSFCSEIPPPPPYLENGPVCGPSSSTTPTTFPNYCAMVKSICLKLGSAQNIPSDPIAAKSGECPTPTTPPPTLPPTLAIQPTQLATDLPLTTANEGETTKAPVEPEVELADPLFTSWSPFTSCQAFDQDKGCGQGVQTRTRSSVPYDDGRPTKVVQNDDVFEIQSCFAPCNPEDPDFDPEDCGDDGICTVYNPVCGVIGTGGSKTFNSECELHLTACKQSGKGNVLYKGPCGTDEGPQASRMCETAGPIEEVRVYTEKNADANTTCIGDKMILKTCAGLLCQGESETCCKATDFEIFEHTLECTDDITGDALEPKTHVYYSAVSCKCEDIETQSLDEPEPL